ncbi:MAG: hypothetical protein AB1330_02535 [Bacillota bacterium]
MRKKWFVTLALVLSLALVGLGLAWWTDQLTIAGTVGTGEVDVVFTGAFTDDDGTVNDPSIDPSDPLDPPTYDKNVAMKEAAISEDGKTLTCTITNGYPSYAPTTYFTITNTGTVPVRITAVTVTPPAGGEVEVTVPDLVGEVIDPEASLNGVCYQHVTEAAAENSSYTYTVTIDAIQWNAQPE